MSQFVNASKLLSKYEIRYLNNNNNNKHNAELQRTAPSHNIWIVSAHRMTTGPPLNGPKAPYILRFSKCY